MPHSIAAAAWKPKGVESLEKAADEAVRSERNVVVVAGPGAGKTELLAQRACFLLETSLCRKPQRILAISFKRDAAKNLRDRVRLRCGPELASRFDSLTFDAFAKSLVDRFRRAVPPMWRPAANYAINFDITERRTRDWLEHIPTNEGGLSRAQVMSLNTERLYKTEFIGKPLPLSPEQPTTTQQAAVASLWSFLLHHGGKSAVNFQMLGRIAEVLLRANPKILKALQVSYAYVFLDEFQDTTGIQYALTKTAFMGTSSVLTAVGDNKQRIMGWAGALDGVFGEFQEDFNAEVLRLANNYRAAPELVRILGHLTKAIDPEAVPPVATDDGTSGPGECRVLVFDDHEAEAKYLAAAIDHWVTGEGLVPRDICVLTRNRPADYTELLRDLLQGKVEARIESELQDLLAEPVTPLVLAMLRLATQAQAGDARTIILDFLSDSGGIEYQAGARHDERRLSTAAKSLREEILKAAKDEAGATKVVERIVQFLTHEALAAAYPQYGQGTFLSDTLSQLAKALAGYLEDREWSDALDGLEGADSVPIMTMHKSKGLEYHTVVFVGLEDSALWGFKNSEAEETRGFFVAFSRAKTRVLFTFCRERPRAPGRAPEAQARTTIGRLYELLKQAGVHPEDVQAPRG